MQKECKTKHRPQATRRHQLNRPIRQEDKAGPGPTGTLANAAPDESRDPPGRRVTRRLCDESSDSEWR